MHQFSNPCEYGNPSSKLSEYCKKVSEGEVELEDAVSRLRVWHIDYMEERATLSMLVGPKLIAFQQLQGPANTQVSDQMLSFVRNCFAASGMNSSGIQKGYASTQVWLDRYQSN